jgi:hypothetical protein
VTDLLVLQVCGGIIGLGMVGMVVTALAPDRWFERWYLWQRRRQWRRLTR